METWVLVIMIWGYNHRMTSESIGGYASLIDCQNAYHHMMDRTKTEGKHQDGFCVPGPKSR